MYEECFICQFVFTCGNWWAHLGDLVHKIGHNTATFQHFDLWFCAMNYACSSNMQTILTTMVVFVTYLIACLIKDLRQQAYVIYMKGVSSFRSPNYLWLLSCPFRLPCGHKIGQKSAILKKKSHFLRATKIRQLLKRFWITFCNDPLLTWLVKEIEDCVTCSL